MTRTNVKTNRRGKNRAESRATLAPPNKVASALSDLVIPEFLAHDPMEIPPANTAERWLLVDWDKGRKLVASGMAISFLVHDYERDLVERIVIEELQRDVGDPDVSWPIETRYHLGHRRLYAWRSQFSPWKSGPPRDTIA